MIHDKLTLITEMAQYPAGTVFRIVAGDPEEFVITRCIDHLPQSVSLPRMLEKGVTVHPAMSDRRCAGCDPGG